MNINLYFPSGDVSLKFLVPTKCRMIKQEKIISLKEY